jgi:OOP family OmpA-OmpF porin
MAKERIMKKHLFSMAFLISLLFSVSSFAGERAGAFSFSTFGGGYTFDGQQHTKTAPTYGIRLGYDLTKNIGIEGIGHFLATEGTHTDTSANAIGYGLDLLYNFMPDNTLVPYLAVGGGGMTAGHGGNFHSGRGDNTDPTLNAGGGLKYFLNDSVALRADARQLVVFDDHHTFLNWIYTAGVTVLFGGQKEATPPPPPPPAPACNLSVTPTSIKKGEKAMLSWTSQNATELNIQPGIGTVNPQGSMEVSPSADTFYTITCVGEGGKASSDANVAVAAPPKPDAEISVTPASITKGDDATLNWSSNNTNECDIQPAIGAVKTQGSMKIKPESDTTYNLVCTGPAGKATSNTSITVAAPTMEELCMTLNIEYDTDKAIIKPPYYGEVEKVADFMKRFPQTKGTIEGHTDNVASAKYNLKLSQRRAESVVKMLVEKYGIDNSRLTAKGYGLTKPIADNKTKEGRQKNRRTVANFGCVTVEKK